MELTDEMIEEIKKSLSVELDIERGDGYSPSEHVVISLCWDGEEFSRSSSFELPRCNCPKSY